MTASPAYDRLPNSMCHIGESRYVRIDDAVILTYHCGAALPEPRQHVWDFRELQWWSRIFEYQWLKDVVGAFLAPDLETKTVLDVGCGLEHPGCFILAESGFGRVVAQDVWERHELIERIHLPNLEYCCMDINEAVPCRADLVCCLSVLEHMDPQQQACALRILCDAVEPGGLLLLTFDMPGFEWDTNLDMYRHILRQREFDFIEVEVPEEQRLTSLTSPVPYAGWESLGRLKLECYRLLAWHTGSVHTCELRDVHYELCRLPGISV